MRRLPIHPPKTRADCLPGGSNASRPCRWASCRWHIEQGMNGVALEKATSGVCTLDHADQGGISQTEIAKLYGVSRAAVQITEQRALAKLQRRALRGEKGARILVQLMAEVREGDGKSRGVDFWQEGYGYEDNGKGEQGKGRNRRE